MGIASKKQALNIKVIYAIGRNASAKRTKIHSETWADFVERMIDYAEDGAPLNGNESKDEYAAYKKRLPYISAQFNGDRSNGNVDCRSLLWVDVDAVTETRMARIKRAVRRSGFASLYHTTTGHQHDVKGAETHSGRFLFPTSRPMTAGEIEHCQFAFTNELCIPATDETANESARVMFVPAPGAKFREYEGEPVDVDYLLTLDGPAPKKAAAQTGRTCTDALSSWAFEMGLEALPSGRGWAIQCPNCASHSDNDGTDGSTAIMMPDSRNSEVRFACRHAHCVELNSHQHMLLKLCGVPDELLPAAHNISARMVAELLPDVDAEAVSEAECVAASGAACNDDDLADNAEEDFAYAPQYTKKDWLIKGFSNFASTFELVGESNIGKSFELLARMACVATGTDYMGWQTRRAHCFYYDAEGGAETETRIDALRQAFNDPLEWLHVVDIQKNGWDITNKADRKKMLEFMIAESKGAPIGLVAFDSLNQTMVNYKAGNFDENNSTDMGKVASALKAIAEITGACAGVVHHPAKSKSGAALRTGRGSGALHGAVDFVHVLEEAGQGQLNMYTEKARGAERKSPFGIKLVKITLDGVEPEQEPERKPFDASAWGLKQHDDPQKHESNVTLFAVPVRQLPFESAAGKAGRKAVSPKYSDGVKNLSKLEMALVDALETLQTKEYRKQGYSGAEICKAADTSVGGDKYKALRDLIDSRDKVLIPGLDSKNRHNKYYRIPVGPNDYEDRETADDDYDLADD